MKKFSLIGISLFGTLFAGYLSAGKFFTGNCTLSEGCSYFLGQPTCYYGFVMFLLLFIFSLGYYFCDKAWHVRAMRVVAMAGLLFSGYFSTIEIIPMVTEGVRYGLFFPSCAYGLIAYALLLYLTHSKGGSCGGGAGDKSETLEIPEAPEA